VMIGTHEIWQYLWFTSPIDLTLVVGFLALAYAMHMPGRSYKGSLGPLSPEELAIRDQLKTHVAMLAGTIGERNLQSYEGLRAAADYVSGSLREMGYAIREHGYTVEGKTVKNLETESPGWSHPSEIVLFGAHYDSVIGSPGANDNATGVAALLALARLAKHQRFGRTLRFVAFVNEEPPYFRTWNMGSRVYASESAQRGERIAAMLSLETIGYYSHVAGSQSYPFPLNYFFPSTGNFIGFVGNIASRRLVRQIVGAFRRHTHFPSQGVAALDKIPGIGASDQWSFWEEGYPAVMVTDTAPYRYQQYHTPLDTPDIIDYDSMARVITGLAGVLREVAG
jgi:hypothetical protein